MASQAFLSETLTCTAYSGQTFSRNIERNDRHVKYMRARMSCRGWCKPEQSFTGSFASGFSGLTGFSGFTTSSVKGEGKAKNLDTECVRLSNISKNCSKRSNRRFEVRARSGGKEPAGDPNSKAILDAFFLGRALAETINEQLGRALGEFISEVNQRQAEQQAQTRQFQDEVKSRAQAALQKATKEALTSQNPYGPSDRSYSPPPSSSSSSVSSTNPPTSVPPEGPL